MNSNDTATLGTCRSMKACGNDCETCEEQEDLRAIQAVCPELHEVEHPSELDPKLQDFYYEVAVYPGHRRVERMKEMALEEKRPTELILNLITWSLNSRPKRNDIFLISTATVYI